MRHSSGKISWMSFVRPLSSGSRRKGLRKNLGLGLTRSVEEGGDEIAPDAEDVVVVVLAVVVVVVVVVVLEGISGSTPDEPLMELGLEDTDWPSLSTPARGVVFLKWPVNKAISVNVSVYRRRVALSVPSGSAPQSCSCCSTLPGTPSASRPVSGTLTFRLEEEEGVSWLMS